MSKDLRKAADLLQQSVIRSCPSLTMSHDVIRDSTRYSDLRVPEYSVENAGQYLIHRYKTVTVALPSDTPVSDAGSALLYQIQAQLGEQEAQQFLAKATSPC